MTLTLDPSLPLLWRTPDSLQLGVDDPPVVLTRVTTAHERMLTGLAIGLTPEGLLLIGTEAGLSRAEVDHFAEQIQPALVAAKPFTTTSVEIDGCGPTADRLEWRLREAGLETRRCAQSPLGILEAEPAWPTDIAIVVGDYVLDPDRRGRWLRRDIPHLPIVYGDTSVTMGPFIEPGTGPCLYCLELHRRDADTAWPALASQLLGKVSAAQTPFVASEIATIATRLVTNRVVAGPAVTATAIILNASTGAIHDRSLRAHPDCACSGIVDVSEQGRQETATVSSCQAVDHLIQTTKDAALCVPA